MAEDKKDDSMDAQINAEQKNARNLAKQRPSSFKPRSPSIASQAQNIFQGAQKGMQSAFQAAQYGDSSLAFFAGASGAFGGPSAQEIENQFVKHEMAAEQQALMQANIMDVAPDQVAEASKFYGADLSGLTVGQFAQMQPIMADAAKTKQLQQVRDGSAGSVLTEGEAQAMAPNFFTTKEQQDNFVKSVTGKTNFDGAVDFANKASGRGTQAGRLEVSQGAQKLKEAIAGMDDDNLAIWMAMNRDELEDNPGLRNAVLGAAKSGKLKQGTIDFIEKRYGTKESIAQRGTESRDTVAARGEEARKTVKASAKARAELQTNAHNHADRQRVLRQEFAQSEARLTPEEKAEWEPIFGRPLPDNLRAINIKQLAQASRISASAAKSRTNARQGMEMAESLMEDLQTAGKSELFLATMEKGFVGDSLRQLSDTFLDTHTAKIEFAKTELQDVITRMRTGAALNNQEIEHYGKLVLKWASDPSRNMMVVKTLHEFFRRVDEDIRRGRRIPGRTDVPLEQRFASEGNPIIINDGDLTNFGDRSDSPSSSDNKPAKASGRTVEDIDAEIKALEAEGKK